ncbi:hypothetical protein PRIPAC_90780 [Pristionchus pacificus]|uniref:Uncharacterized protein n=1 Tax=Pristionchus pacificus TaxID=54126 RepID=A0A2A6CY43_PRIPA|nr:hypothetical protein PRIPAC_90780 [Pristionchus pacificus]|eukprot:PDM83095.1 hypothetical protein PRIPAC_37488 [Pristionchus pacificus]
MTRYQRVVVGAAVGAAVGATVVVSGGGTVVESAPQATPQHPTIRIKISMLADTAHVSSRAASYT